MIDFIVPVHNHWKTTAVCIASILKSNIPYPYKIHVIDDVSTDYTPSFLLHLKKEGHPIKIYTNEENIGYVGSTNKVLENLSSPYIFFMNNDIFVDKQCILTLLGVFDGLKDIGVLGGCQCDQQWNPVAPLKFFLRGENATIRDHIAVSQIPENLKEADVIYCDDVHFACALTSKKVVDKVGLLDNAFAPGNYDQEDYCLRVKEASYQVGVCPRAKFIHYGSVSVSDNLAYYSKILDRNRQIFFDKWGEKLRQNLV